MVHICLDTNETLYLSVCTIDVYVCTFLGNKISINQSKIRSDAGRHNNQFHCILLGIDSKGTF